jgi:MarR family transcriptional regulator, organic hydroperoxide resistance regulator
MSYEQLKLENQICFPLYAASRLITREYQPYLEQLNITYPQYLVLMVLWEKDSIQVSEITERLILNTNTITPVLKRMEAQGLIERERSKDDERKVLIRLTKAGSALEQRAAYIPEKLVQAISATGFDISSFLRLKNDLNQIIFALNNKQDKSE